MTKKENNNLGELINNLSKISDWFESQEEIDIEIGLQKIKEATSLIKESKKRLKEVENEFEEIKKEL
ncbi:MAG: hypothetical protein PHX52_00060 [Candidatus Pacebacteria bacterium]|nr:hypothetical protein [Bacteroidales bacterium]MDD3032789.1 hypothetical protein [Candidatus Paceibacterota bacterium]MDD3918958.1 hypothetical protein [Candidatus Paceibacterota bacterium]